MKLKVFLFVIISGAIYCLLWFFHIVQRGADITVQDALINNAGSGFVRVDEIVPGAWDAACVVASYWKPDALELSLADKRYLSLFINGYVGQNDNLWWIVILRGGRVSELYKIRKYSAFSARSAERRFNRSIRLPGSYTDGCVGRESAMIVFDTIRNPTWVAFFDYHSEN